MSHVAMFKSNIDHYHSATQFNSSWERQGTGHLKKNVILRIGMCRLIPWVSNDFRQKNVRPPKNLIYILNVKQFDDNIWTVI